METFMFDAFVCDDCGTSNFEQEVTTFIGGDYVVECGSCGGVHRFGNMFEDQVSAAHDAYNDMVRGK